MKVALIGGTGKLGLGFAIRLSQTGHEVMIGSRDAARARDAAASVNEKVKSGTNAEAAAWCDVAIVSVPYQSHTALLTPLKTNLQGKMIIDATVPIDPANMLQTKTETGKSAAQETADIVGNADVFAAFQTISHRILRHPEARDYHVLIGGPDDRKSHIVELVRSMNLRPINAGPLAVAPHLERMTLLLLSINKANKVKESGIQITGI
jgi:8-hydroxy-5-deazaflavin:NADPH oxidoreductase